MDGAVLFKEEAGRKKVSVRGVGDVQTRNWVDYSHTAKSVNLGAFALQRIR